MDHYLENKVEFSKRKKYDVMKNFRKIISSLALLLVSVVCFGQDKKVEMADFMRSNGRIYVLVAVVVTILIGLILYVWRIDRKISKLEKNN